MPTREACPPGFLNRRKSRLPRETLLRFCAIRGATADIRCGAPRRKRQLKAIYVGSGGVPGNIKSGTSILEGREREVMNLDSISAIAGNVDWAVKRLNGSLRGTLHAHARPLVSSDRPGKQAKRGVVRDAHANRIVLNARGVPQKEAPKTNENTGQPVVVDLDVGSMDGGPANNVQAPSGIVLNDVPFERGTGQPDLDSNSVPSYRGGCVLNGTVLESADTKIPAENVDVAAIDGEALQHDVRRILDVHDETGPSGGIGDRRARNCAEGQIFEALDQDVFMAASRNVDGVGPFVVQQLQGFADRGQLVLTRTVAVHVQCRRTG